MNSLGAALLTKLEQNNCKGAIVPIHRLHNLQQAMEKLYQSSLIHNDLIHKYLKGFQYDYSAVLSNAQSVIIAAIPQPITILRFVWRKKEQAIVVPPTYIYTEAEKHVLHITEGELIKENFSLVRAKLPLKLLAVKSGLSQYGRNNISYISGMGSFYRLIALVSDMPSDSDTWLNIQRMPACNNCLACLNSCPAKCIDINSNIIRATKCLTYINESPEPFPDWAAYNWHNSLVGCMRCQLACPQSRDYILTRNFGEILTESEIGVLLNETDFTSLPKTTFDILEKLNLTDYELTTLQRNLKALLRC
ncbi:MAG TPA: 4Fe-4S double cluster binding domain-containing protein [Negativicutes bacterium]